MAQTLVEAADLPTGALSTTEFPWIIRAAGSVSVSDADPDGAGTRRLIVTDDQGAGARSRGRGVNSVSPINWSEKVQIAAKVAAAATQGGVSGSGFGVAVCADLASAGSDGYVAVLQWPSSDTVGLYGTAGSDRQNEWSLLDSAALPDSFTVDEFWVIRMERDPSGPTIRVKAWKDGESEPGSWQVEVVDSTYSTGEVGVMFGPRADPNYVEWIGIGTAGDVAPMPGGAPAAHELTGWVDAVGSLTADLVARRAVVGSVDGQASLSGAMTRTRDLAGSVDATAILDAELTTRRVLAGTVDSSAVLTADLVARRVLAGSLIATGSLAGSILRTRDLTGSVDAAAALTADAVIRRALAGSIDSQSSLAGALAIAEAGLHELSGLAAASAGLDGSLIRTRNLAGQIAAASTLTVDLTARRALAGTVPAAAALQGELQRRVFLSGYVTAISTFAGVIVVVAAAPPPPFSLSASYDTCGPDIGTLGGCRAHFETGETYCDRCNAAWLATLGKLNSLSAKPLADRTVRDEQGVLPAAPIRRA